MDLLELAARRWSSGDRSERATGSTPPTPLIESRVDWAPQLTGLVALTRAREADTPIQRRRSAGRPAPYGSAAWAALRLWVTSPFLFRGIRSRRSGRMMMMLMMRAPRRRRRTMERGRSARTMMMSAAAPAMVSSGRFSQLRGHRQQIEKSAALTVDWLAVVLFSAMARVGLLTDVAELACQYHPWLAGGFDRNGNEPFHQIAMARALGR